jgi:hypothetical protein
MVGKIRTLKYSTTMNMRNLFLSAAALCTAVVTLPFSISADEYIIVGSPESYSILNQYEQPLSQTEIDNIGGYCPFRIINADGMLGDQITPAIKTELNSRSYYIQKDGKWENGSGYLRKYRDCRTLNDTVQIMKALSVEIASANRNNLIKEKILPGQKLKRIFYSGGRYYVRILFNTGYHAWVSSDSDSWRIIKNKQFEASAESRDSIDGILVKRVESVIDSANAAYTAFFDHFNQLTGQEKTIPFWTKQKSGKFQQWILNEPYRQNGQLDQSSYQLAQQLSRMLVGRRCSAQYENGSITVLEMKDGR